LKNRKIPNRFCYYPGTTHGFAVRSDPKDEIAAKAKREAFEESVKFFKERL
jgi:dienelactone hydrolase